MSRNTLAALETGGNGRGGLVGTLEAYDGAIGAGLHLAAIASERAFYVHAGNSSTYYGWETPAALVAVLTAAAGGFNLDPCAACDDRRRALKLWAAKCADAAASGALVVGLLPARPDKRL